MNFRALINNFLDFYKDRYVMPKDFRPILSKKNLQNSIIVLHGLALFGMITLCIFVPYHMYEVTKYTGRIFYFSLYIILSFVDLLIVMMLRRRKENSCFAMNFPFYFLFFGMIGMALYLFFGLNQILSGIILFICIGIVAIVSFHINLVFFDIMIFIPLVLFSIKTYRELGLTACIDLIIVTGVICLLAMFKRRVTKRDLRKNQLLEKKNDELEFEVVKQNEEIKYQTNALKNQQEKIISIQNNTIISLSNLVENRDSDTGEHVRRTSAYVKLLARKTMQNGYYTDILNEHYIQVLTKAAPMHDIGKIVVPDAILKKPDRLTPEEFEIMKKHTTEGGRIVREVIGEGEDKEYIEMASEVATSHHECWDGSGYPYGLKGEEIPLSARIMALADVFDALVSPRCYKEPFSVSKAFEIIRNEAGSHFDPVLAKEFLEMQDDVVAVMEKYGDKVQFQ